MPKKPTVTGPHSGSAAPYGKVLMHWQAWFVRVPERPDAALSFQRFAGRREYLMHNFWPRKSFKSKRAAVAYCARLLRDEKHPDWRRTCT